MISGGAALAIAGNYRYFPDKTVHVVVVDPGVGSVRRPLLVATGQHYFIGPDNGVFSSIFEMEKTNLQVIRIDAEHYFLKSVSPTFQGRDLFAPVAAWLSTGKSFYDFGRIITDYKTVNIPAAGKENDMLTGEIVYIDKFGNCISNISQSEIDALAGGVEVFFRGKMIPLQRYYGSVSDRELYAVINSSDSVELFVNMASAAEMFSISVGDVVKVRLIQ